MKASENGSAPTVIFLVTVFAFESTEIFNIVTLFDSRFATYANVPEGLMANEVGFKPTGNDSTIEFVNVFIKLIVLLPELVNKMYGAEGSKDKRAGSELALV